MKVQAGKNKVSKEILVSWLPLSDQSKLVYEVIK